MWSDRLSAARRQEIVSALRRVLPGPSPAASMRTVSIVSSAAPLDVASGLQASPGFIWLDPAGSTHRLLHDPLVRMSVTAGKATVTGPSGNTEEIEVQGFDLLEAAFEAWRSCGGGVLCGYLGYELGAEIEGLATPSRRESDLPDLFVCLYDRVLEYGPNGWSYSAVDAWRRNYALLFPEVQAEDSEAHGLSPERIVSTPSNAGFEAAVQDIVDRIFHGEVFQVNICRRLETALEPSGIWPAYLRLRATSPASQGAFIRLDSDTAILSISPELFLSVQDGRVRSCPIKGTRKRGATAEADRLLVQELLHSEKDRAELAMIVDVTRNDLGRACVPGSIAVASHARLMSLPTVHHLFSEVTGRLRPDTGFAGLLRASFPSASISGAPKIRAVELAAQAEGRRRGPCMGSIGWMALDGKEMNLSVAIRTAVTARGHIWYLAGCGITAGSVAAEELAESEAKASAFERSLTKLDRD